MLQQRTFVNNKDEVAPSDNKLDGEAIGIRRTICCYMNSQSEC